MVLMSYVPAPHPRPRITPVVSKGRQAEFVLQESAQSPETQRRGVRVGTAHVEHRRIVQHGERRDEQGAEMVEFAFVVVLLIALLYGIITYGLILAAQATVTQAAADGYPLGHHLVPTAVATAQAQAGTDVGWMNKGTCGTSGTTITCVASVIPCPSNANNNCLKVTVTYNYARGTPIPGAARPGSHHPEHDLVDQRPPAHQPELVGGTHAEGARFRAASCGVGRRDERGATLVFTAVCMVVLLWAGAMGVDVGFSVYGSRQAQAMADTAALDMARYINIADTQTPTRPELPQREAGRRPHRQRVERLAHGDPGPVAQRCLVGAGQGLCPHHAAGGQPVQRRDGHGQPERAPDLLRRVQRAGRHSGARLDHRRGHAGVGLQHRILPGQLQHAADRGAQHHPEPAGNLGQRDRRGLPGPGQHLRDRQPADLGVERAPHERERHDDVAQRRPVALHLGHGGRARRP